MAVLDDLWMVSDVERELFLAETRQHLALLEEGLLKLEQQADREVVGALFRSAHTIKSSAATFGLAAMASLVHAMESRLDRFRTGSEQPGPEAIDALLRAVDVLRAMSDRPGAGQDPELPADLIRDLAAPEPDSGRTGPELTREPPSPPDHLEIIVQFDDECPLPAGRALQVLLSLEELGEIICSLPDRSEIENLKLWRQIRVWLGTDAPRDQLIRAIQQVPHVASIDIRSPGQLGDSLCTGTNGATATIGVEVLDDLLTMAGRLAASQRQIALLSQQLLSGGNRHIGEDLARLAADVATTAGAMQNRVMEARLVPFSEVCRQLPRLIRGLSRQQGKQVQLTVRGQSTRLDRSVVELVRDALGHLVRNSIDHGIESPDQRQLQGKNRAGLIEITARQDSGRTIICVTDDGRGIDSEEVRQLAIDRGLVSPEAADGMADSQCLSLIFCPDLSSSPSATEVSGRGVGLDVVRHNIERAGGRVEVRSTPGRGTTFRLLLPPPALTGRRERAGDGDAPTQHWCDGHRSQGGPRSRCQRSGPDERACAGDRQSHDPG